MYEMNKTNRGTWKKVLLIFLTAVFVLLTIASCIFTLCRIPVSLTYAEAIEEVRYEGDTLYVTRTDKVTGASDYNSNFVYTTYRCRWWYNTQPESKLDRKVAQYTMITDAWYLGSVANGEDVQLYDFEGKDRNLDGITISHTMEYLCFGVLAAGIISAGVGFALRHRKAGRVFISLALMFLLMSASCLFVTGGRMRYCYTTFSGEVNLMYYFTFIGIKYVMIFLTAMFSWGACMSATGLVRQFRKR